MQTMPSPLFAPPASGPLSGKVRVASDKSISHRALMLGGLAVGTSTISGLLEGEDIMATAAAMRALGARVTRIGCGKWQVQGLSLIHI